MKQDNLPEDILEEYIPKEKPYSLRVWMFFMGLWYTAGAAYTIYIVHIKHRIDWSTIVILALFISTAFYSFLFSISKYEKLTISKK